MSNAVQIKLAENTNSTDTLEKKCTYCESMQNIQTDHYRPINGLTDFDDSKQKFITVKKHNGYYWLKNEETNLQHLCFSCNNTKRNRFPIEGKRIYKAPKKRNDWLFDAQLMYNEKPLLLSKYDNIREHFKMDCNGALHGKTHKGKITIKVCELDKKEILRKTIIDEIFSNIEKELAAFNGLKLNIRFNRKIYNAIWQVQFDKIKEFRKNKYEYSMVYQTIYDEFDSFVEINCKRSSADDKEVIKKAFKLLK